MTWQIIQTVILSLLAFYSSVPIATKLIFIPLMNKRLGFTEDKVKEYKSCAYSALPYPFMYAGLAVYTYYFLPPNASEHVTLYIVVFLLMVFVNKISKNTISKQAIQVKEISEFIKKRNKEKLDEIKELLE